MRIRLKERRQETADVISFVYDLGGQPFECAAGQFVYYELDELAFPDARGKRRHFTLSSAPSETRARGVIMFTTKLRGSGFKETLRHAPLGYELTVESPNGRFTLPEAETRPHIFIAGGIGITPYRSILRNAADTKTALNATLLYFNLSSAEIIFRDELENLPRQMPAFNFVPILDQPDTDWHGESGRLNETLLEKHAPAFREALIWISGPPPMVNAYRELLSQYGLNQDNVRIDSFTGYD